MLIIYYSFGSLSSTVDLGDCSCSKSQKININMKNFKLNIPTALLLLVLGVGLAKCDSSEKEKQITPRTAEQQKFMDQNYQPGSYATQM